MTAWAVILAAGAGERLGAERGAPKALRMLGDKAMFMYSVQAVQAVHRIDGVVVVVPANWMGHAAEHAGGHGGRLVVDLLPGGVDRQASARAGLAAVPDDVEQVVVHDAARPLAGPELFERALDALAGAEGAVCAVPCTDTLKRAPDGQTVEQTVQRDGLWRAQTPQAFRARTLRDAHARASAEGWSVTDDASALERAGYRVVLVPGDERNIKVTTPADHELVEALVRQAS